MIRSDSRYDIIFGSEAPRLSTLYSLQNVSRASHMCRSRHREAIVTNKYSNFKQALQLQSLLPISTKLPSLAALSSHPVYHYSVFHSTILSTPLPNNHLRTPKRTREQNLRDESDGKGRLLDEMPEINTGSRPSASSSDSFYLPPPGVDCRAKLMSLLLRRGFEALTSAPFTQSCQIYLPPSLQLFIMAYKQ
jgi:hypothetical protein